MTTITRTPDTDKNRRRLQRLARTQGLRLERSRTRMRHLARLDYGTYRIVRPTLDEFGLPDREVVVARPSPSEYGLTLAEAEAVLTALPLLAQ